jgi:hypothetical protein
LLCTMDIGECGNDRPGFGVQPVSQKLVANNYKRLLELLELDMFRYIPILSDIFQRAAAPLTSELECSGMVVCPHPLPVHASDWPSVAAPNRGSMHIAPSH